MKNNKLIALLRTFSSNDFFHFRKYIDSPFFNENEELVRLFDLLQEEKYLNEQTENGDERLGIWKKLFPQKPYDDTRYRRLFSDLLRLAMDFLAYQQYQQNPASNRVLLLRALTGTRLEKHFAGVVRQTNRELKNSGYRDADHHYLSYMLQRRQHEQLEHISQKSTSFEFLEKADFHLDCYYLAKKLEHYSDTLGYQDMTANTANIHLFPDLLNYLRGTPYLNEPAVKAWYLVISMMLDREEESYFLQLKALLREQGQLFQKQARKTLFIHLMNYCIYSKIHNDRPEYYTELLSLYQTALDKEIIFENGELDLRHYKNIITISLHVKEFSWVEDFIQNYTHLLPKTDQENALNYNLANVYFHKGEYEKVIEQLREVEYQTIEYALGSKLLLLRTYFELDEDQALDSLVDSFRIYLRRNRLISKDEKQRHLNLLRFTRKLATLAPYDQAGKEKLRLQIEKCKALAAKKWLLGKLGGT